MRKPGPLRLKPMNICFNMYGLKPVPFRNLVILAVAYRWMHGPIYNHVSTRK